MSEGEKLVFNNISGESWNKLVNKVKNDFQIEVLGFVGAGKKYGYAVSWDLDPESGTLTVQCTEKPSSTSSESINRDITNFINANK